MEGSTYRPSALIVLGVVVAIAIAIAGCSPISPPEDSHLVPLATNEPVVPNEDGSVECLLASHEGTLAPHPTSGLGLAHANGDVFPIVWPHGWVGRRAEDGVELVAADGHVVAQTGDYLRGAGGQASVEGEDAFAICPVNIEVVPAA